MKRLQQIIAWLIILLGLRFALIAPHEFANSASPWPTAFWLLNTSLFFLVCGALNLLRTRYMAVAPGIRAVATATNVALAALVLTAGIAGGEAIPSAVVALVLLIAAAFGLRPLGRA